MTLSNNYESKYEETVKKYHDERNRNVELLSELTKILEDIRFLTLENKYMREKIKNDMNRYKNMDKGFEIDELGQLWVLVEEFYYDHNEVHPDDKNQVELLRVLYEERECGKFYKLITREKIRELIRAN